MTRCCGPDTDVMRREKSNGDRVLHRSDGLNELGTEPEQFGRLITNGVKVV